ncbi:type IV toxin-antitoxin system AbiEi family antitoxin domain-containing protein [Solimonas soli]|uniref:type IV toxin-antitoxin system AbiEi family antitoxin domain-containing protein n=1 Tax=Solimonas soli TaxID=413479 RepID=UPI0005BAB87D
MHSADEQSKSERILALVQELGVLRPKDLGPHHIQAEYLRRLCDRGQLKKLGRGSYVLAERKPSFELSLALVARAVPNGVVCLQSALAFHGLGEANAREISVAIERRAAKPRLDFPALRIARLGGEAFSGGVAHHRIEHVDVAVYTLEKTLADLFKFRNKIGPHIAVDALRAALAKRQVDMLTLQHYAQLCRVERVMKPYVDALHRGVS